MQSLWQNARREVQTTLGRRRNSASGTTSARVVRVPAGTQDLSVHEADDWNVVERTTSQPEPFTERFVPANSAYLVGGEAGAADEEDAAYRRIWGLPDPPPTTCGGIAAQAPIASTNQTYSTLNANNDMVLACAVGTGTPPPWPCVRPSARPFSPAATAVLSCAGSNILMPVLNPVHVSEERCESRDGLAGTTCCAVASGTGQAVETDVSPRTFAIRPASDSSCKSLPAASGMQEHSTGTNAGPKVTLSTRNAERGVRDPTALPSEVAPSPATPRSVQLASTSVEARASDDGVRARSRADRRTSQRSRALTNDHEGVGMRGEGNPGTARHQQTSPSATTIGAIVTGMCALKRLTLLLVGRAIALVHWTVVGSLQLATGLLQAHHPSLTMYYFFVEPHCRKCMKQCIMLNLLLFRVPLYAYEVGLPALCNHLLGIKLHGDWRYETAVLLLWTVPAYAICEVVSMNVQFKMAQKMLSGSPSSSLADTARVDPPVVAHVAVSACAGVNEARLTGSTGLGGMASVDEASAHGSAAGTVPAGGGEQRDAMLSFTSVLYNRLIYYLAFVLQIRLVGCVPVVGSMCTPILTALLHAYDSFEFVWDAHGYGVAERFALMEQVCTWHACVPFGSIVYHACPQPHACRAGPWPALVFCGLPPHSRHMSPLVHQTQHWVYFLGYGGLLAFFAQRLRFFDLFVLRACLYPIYIANSQHARWHAHPCLPIPVFQLPLIGFNLFLEKTILGK